MRVNRLTSLTPAVARVSVAEAARAGLGAAIGLGVAGLVLMSPQVDTDLGLYLVAPFGASSVLLFAVPNSPLAQPFSAIVGNTVAALVGVAVCLTVPDPLLRIALAVGLAITATMLCRAVHPPAGAVAMTAAMSPDAIAHLGFWFALAPIAVGTTALVVLAALYARLTGRRYPFRQLPEAAPARPDPLARLGLTEGDLSGLLERYRQSFNMGAADLARLIGAAEMTAAARASGPLTAGDVMSRDLVTVGPEAALEHIADLFQRYRFTALPVVGAEGAFLGVIFQLHLIGRAFSAPRGAKVRAETIMERSGPRAQTGTPLAALLPMMAEGETDAVPILDAGRIVGIVTRTDLVAALARSALA
ncbi:CBS domain-containing protein (plasmid) [Falsirhodobacter algicola]|uniref:CBS domain-containing protein n=1 Tax=Falsirhodobacter algicola TaxID=2692330 RepID=A0A8J8MUM9_9RHOB|nr:HPP family protein [Falsirhodobacter algicola]QUS36995.1 CBS domain-containing protein [Falsirhodobacter algicola]